MPCRSATGWPARGGGVIHRLVWLLAAILLFGLWTHETWRHQAAMQSAALWAANERAHQTASTAIAHQTTLTEGTCACNKTLLILIFNVAFYNNVAHIRSLYGPTFCHIAYYGPTANSTLGVRANVDRSGGWLQHQTIAQAYKDHPGYDGYMWAGDDVLFNPWHLLASPRAPGLDKVWVMRAEKVDIVDMGNRPHNWLWYAPFKTGVPSGYTDLNPFLKARLPERIKKRQISNLGGSRLVKKGSDFGYIPGRLMPEFAAIVGIEGVRVILFEIFIPTFTRLLSDNRNDFVELNGEYLWTDDEKNFWTKRFNCSSTDFVHPVKLSADINHERIRNETRIQHCSWTRPLPGVAC